MQLSVFFSEHRTVILWNMWGTVQHGRFRNFTLFFACFGELSVNQETYLTNFSKICSFLWTAVLWTVSRDKIRAWTLILFLGGQVMEDRNWLLWGLCLMEPNIIAHTPRTPAGTVHTQYTNQHHMQEQEHWILSCNMELSSFFTFSSFFQLMLNFWSFDGKCFLDDLLWLFICFAPVYY